MYLARERKMPCVQSLDVCPPTLRGAQAFSLAIIKQLQIFNLKVSPQFFVSSWIAHSRKCLQIWWGDSQLLFCILLSHLHRSAAACGPWWLLLLIDKHIRIRIYRCIYNIYISLYIYTYITYIYFNICLWSLSSSALHPSHSSSPFYISLLYKIHAYPITEN